ncbi:OmpA family protein [Colwellia sp. UCD-KL20]|uniref:OmpA family protein n=1 Tax=Colwellia sp. UCD-KL20 TaxID=1917165 RepID=UPI0009711C60|nr:OmpA family protein [Colwellia sp. UCD-KL20]
MNKLITLNRTLKLLVTSFALMLITSCATQPIVVIEEPVKQLENLDDYDSDGVIKARDKCANTVLGASIDNYGCGTKKQLNEPLNIDIKFANNSYEVPRSAYSKIKALADFLNEHKDVNVIIEGHTSKVGMKDLNQTLSENRANAIVQVLVNEFHIDKSRVSSFGYGFDRLEAEGDTPEAHAINRRIMAKVNTVKRIDDMKWTIYTVNQAL